MLHKRNFMVAVIFMLGSVFCAQNALAEVAVIVHPSNDASLDKKTIVKLYMGKKSKFTNGRIALTLNAAVGSAIRDEFNNKVIGRSSQKVNAYWAKLVFTGKGIPPKEVNSDAETIETVAANADAIGYIDAASVTDSVKVIATF